MKKYITIILSLALTLQLFNSCGSDYLETDYHGGVDINIALTSVDNIQTALSGTYYRLFDYRFAGNYATSIGDIPTDLTYWNTSTGHWNNIYTYRFTDTDTYLSNIWTFGYKVIDNSARIIKASKELYEESSDSDKTRLDRIIAEAYALRGYAMLTMVNIYGHQVKVKGNDFSSTLGMVLAEEPILPFTNVERATVGDTYQSIISDFNNSLQYFEKFDNADREKCYFTAPAVKGLLARTYLYLEKWDEASEKALEAIEDSGLTMIYTATQYKALYNGGSSNTESIFYLAIDANTNWSANSCGTLWSTYSFSPSPKLFGLYSDNDIRLTIMDLNENAPVVPTYKSGKFGAFSTGNPANATNYLVNIPEMYLIAAEGYINLDNLNKAAEILLNVSKRNSDISSVSDLPTTKEELYSFLKEERARELFQEGLRLWDLRRWDESAQVYAYDYPNIAFRYNDYKISDLLFPIPASEINANFGVVQNEWSSTLPQ